MSMLVESAAPAGSMHLNPARVDIANSIDEAMHLVGTRLAPHRLKVHQRQPRGIACLSALDLGDCALASLQYGFDVDIDAGFITDYFMRYTSIDEAIQRANALEVGLGGSVWGNDPEVASKYASRLECGTAWVNQHGTLHPMAPFGGVKCSGIGVEFNVDGLKEYTTVQVVNVAR